MKLLLTAALVLAGLLLFWSPTLTQSNDQMTDAVTTQADPDTTTGKPWSGFQKPDKKALKKSLSKMQYYVTQEDGTERSFTGDTWDNKEPGIYVDVVSGEPLFSSTTKYRSGTGWPSFWEPIDPSFIVEKTDYKLGMARTEIRSKIGDSHLGHVFTDGPEPTGLRYCMNSAAMRFVPLADLEAEGYGEFLGLFEGE